MRTRGHLVLFTLIVSLSLEAPRAAADCGVITFEQFAAGTPITTQYAGVTFSTVGIGSCVAQPPEIEIAPAPGTVSPTRVLTNPHACTDGNSEMIIMRFDENQTEVSFALGLAGLSSVAIRAYAVSVDGSPVINQVVAVPSTFGVFRQVRLTAPVIRRVELGPIDGANSVRIDDLRFSFSERPQAEISAPVDGACLCGPTVEVRGIACDPNGLYARDRLEYQPYPSPPGAPWTLVGDEESPVCSEGELYNWDISGLAEGTYKLLLTVENDCGYSRSAVAVVHVDRSFDTLEIRQPTNAFTYGGTVCFDGTANDECFDFYELEWSLAGSSVFAPIDPASLTYDTAVINDPLGTWNTAARPDGSYTVRLTGTTTCGNSRSVTRNITLDNTAPIAEISSPTYCSYVNSEGNVQIHGRVHDASLTGWVLQYSQVGTGTWVTIATGATNLPANSLIATWNTSGLPHCAYMLRLVVNTNTRVNCDDDPQSAIDQVAVNIGCEEDINADGVIDIGDLALLLAAFGSICP